MKGIARIQARTKTSIGEDARAFVVGIVGGQENNIIGTIVVIAI